MTYAKKQNGKEKQIIRKEKRLNCALMNNPAIPIRSLPSTKQLGKPANSNIMFVSSNFKSSFVNHGFLVNLVATLLNKIE